MSSEENKTPVSSTEIRVVPRPKSVEFEGGMLTARGNKPIFRLVSVDFKTGRYPLNIVASELAALAGDCLADSQSAEGEFTVEINIDPELSSPSPEGYRLDIHDTIRLSARDIPGVLYGVATLRQLARKDSQGGFEFPRCRIVDFPDIPFRFAARWLVELEGSRMMFDWGDGREKMLARYRDKIDFCMRHKINMAFFDGFEWKTDKYPEYIADVRSLNAYARERNVRLEFGGHGIGYGGYPGHTYEGIRGLGGFNRHSYPDGEIYPCGMLPGTPFDPEFPAVTSEAMCNGTCRSNEMLNELKRRDLHEYVGKIEPGILYIHSEDIAAYSVFEKMWRARCPVCRSRWPSDDLAAEDGAAAAIAHGFDCLWQGVASVKNPSNGYDGAHDCLLVFASPTYGNYQDDDETFEKISAFWTMISKKLGHSGQILFCMREQFFSADGKNLRIRQLADRLVEQGGGHGLFVFAVSGADMWNNSALFSSAPRLNHFYEGARGLFNFNGGLFAAPQEISNAEYTWNLQSSYGIDEARDAETAQDIYRKRSELMLHPENDQLLADACRLCYGDAAAEMLEFYKLRDENGNFPAAMTYLLCRRLFRKKREAHDHAEQTRQWMGINAQTREALILIDRALEHQLPNPGIRAELEYLRGSLVFGREFSTLVSDAFQIAADVPQLKRRVADLRQKIAGEYPWDFTSDAEGERNLWGHHLDKLQIFLDT